MPNARQAIPSHNLLLNMALTKVGSSISVASLTNIARTFFGKIKTAIIRPALNFRSSIAFSSTTKASAQLPSNLVSQILVCFAVGSVPTKPMDMLS